MFDIGFWELIILFGIALLVLGPERLPRVAATAGRWVGEARAVVRNLQRQINLEAAMQEVREKAAAGPAADDKGTPHRDSEKPEPSPIDRDETESK